MKLTNTQLSELLNQHTGTGYLLIKLNDKTVRISDIYQGRDGAWHIGLDGKPLAQGLADIGKEIIDN